MRLKVAAPERPLGTGNRPISHLDSPRMPPLLTFDEALELAATTDHEGICDLVERAWAVRTERFADSTDLCSLVNAKSGGCAEDCGFCAQSRYAEADTPMPGSSGFTTTSRRHAPTTRRSPRPSATRAACERSTRSRTPGWRPASA